MLTTKKERITKYYNMLEYVRNKPLLTTKISLVNLFWNNQIIYQSDDILYNKEDYWATPMETLSLGFGDCDDYAIAKYFTLKELGIPSFIVVGRSYKMSHMWLMANNWVLDNPPHNGLTKFGERGDLKILFKFNEDNIIAKGKLMPNTLKKWKQVQERYYGKNNSNNH